MELLKTVAFADDEKGIIHILNLSCSTKYQIVGTAENGVDAVALVKDKRPNVIVMDLHMPLMDGLEALTQIHALGTTAVVILTADQSPESARKAMDLGACAYMTKPFDASQIIPILESAWHHHETVKILREAAQALAETLETRKLLEKAKGILMEQQGYSEEEAHRTIQKMSQDQGVTVKELCRSLIQVKMVLGSKLKSKKAA